MNGPRRERVTANGIDFEYLVQGNGDRLALCLHGFPDDASSMKPLLSRLAEVGFTAVAPYMRGYGPTDVPSDGDYTAGALGRDAIALANELGGENPILVGHDWGAVAAYTAASIDPGRFSHVVAMAVPPNFPARARSNPRQWLRSWYMAFFQLPELPEHALRAEDFALIDVLWGLWGPGEYSEAHVESVKDTFREPGTVEAALAYYRQFARQVVQKLLSNDDSAGGGIRVPGLVIAGDRDRCIGTELFIDADDAFDAPCRVITVREAGHFVHREQPNIVAEEILAFVE
ncbi:MAG TPA: alpha/beta hydrolase [Halococcus sp.]|nr:alpha/beta hydrolase [Halococcus sp.]